MVDCDILIPEFIKFSKIPRLSREIIITEKIDGTNAQIYIYPDLRGDLQILAGSRSRWLNTTEKGGDNHGFCKWVEENKEGLIKELGEGRHFGEWWGHGINRGYGLKEKRFSLFNVTRWKDTSLTLCSVVPILYEDRFDTENIDYVLAALKQNGSFIEPGFMNPEGIVILHTTSGHLYKKTILNDDKPKGE